MSTDIQIIECYKDLAVTITLQQCKEYYEKLLKVDSYRSSNRKWYLQGIANLRRYLIEDSWLACFGADMEYVVLELERRAKNNEPMAWKRLVDTGANHNTLRRQ